jgi:hypothetical protein
VTVATALIDATGVFLQGLDGIFVRILQHTNAFTSRCVSLPLGGVRGKKRERERERERERVKIPHRGAKQEGGEAYVHCLRVRVKDTEARKIRGSVLCFAMHIC